MKHALLGKGLNVDFAEFSIPQYLNFYTIIKITYTRTVDFYSNIG